MGLPLQLQKLTGLTAVIVRSWKIFLSHMKILYSFSCKIMCLDIIVCHLESSVILTNDNGLFLVIK